MSTNTTEYLDLYLHGTSMNDNILSKPLELFFQEIELAIQIGPNEIWGMSDAINLSRYLFNQFVTVTQIRNEITNYVVKNCQHASSFPYIISVETLKNNNGSDLIYIAFKVSALDQNGNPQDYMQKFLLGSKN